jgi:aspartokinase-like uncharacterized kinase
MNKPTIVVKVGGSLFDWPQLGPRLQNWIPTLSPGQVLLIPGGGPTVDVVRNLDRCHGLGEEAAHWLALGALTVNAYFLAIILTPLNAAVVSDFQECKSVWAKNKLPVLDPLPFARNDEGHPGQLRHLWSATSDSLAARIASRIEAQKLILLKSTPVPKGEDWMSNPNFVDPHFSKTINHAISDGLPLEVSALNFREG